MSMGPEPSQAPSVLHNARRDGHGDNTLPAAMPNILLWTATPPPRLWGTREGTAAQLGQEFGRAGTPATRHLAHGCSCGCLASTSLPREPAPKLVQGKLAGARFELQTLLRQGDTVQWTPRTRPLCQLWEVSPPRTPVDAQRGLADSCPSSLGTTKHDILSATQ